MSAPGAMNRRALLLLAALCAGYILSQFYRAANAVIGPDLMRDLGLSPGELGIMTGAFFIAFTLCQIPVGLLIDRSGPKRTILITLGFAIAGAAGFAASSSLFSLSVSRAILGIGSSALLIAPLVLYTRWFPPDRFATVSAIHVGIGSAGSLLATAPLALVAELIGWRGAFWAMAAITLAYTAILIAFVHDWPEPNSPQARSQGETLRQSLSGLREAVSRPLFPYMFGVNLTLYSSTITVLGLWGGPYLHDVHGLDGPARGSVLLFMAIGSVLGYFVFGPLDRVFDTRKAFVAGGSCTIMAILYILAFVPGLTVTQVTILLALQGLTSGSVVMQMAHSRSIFPPHLLGRGMSSLNIATMGGAALMQIVTGFIVNGLTPPGEPTPEIAYRVVFGLLASMIALAMIGYMRVPDAKPSQERLASKD